VYFKREVLGQQLQKQLGLVCQKNTLLVWGELLLMRIWGPLFTFTFDHFAEAFIHSASAIPLLTIRNESNQNMENLKMSEHLVLITKYKYAHIS